MHTDDLYGTSPSMMMVAEQRIINAMPAEDRAALIRSFVTRQLLVERIVAIVDGMLDEYSLIEQVSLLSLLKVLREQPNMTATQVISLMDSS